MRALDKQASGPADSARGPQVARVDIRTLRRLREVLDGHASAAEIEKLRADLDHLIDRARWAGEPL